ncbi:MAG: nucleotidyltransferase family protein [Pseudomonadota bacterium]
MSEARLVQIARADPVLWAALTAARDLDLPDWWIVSGAVYQTIWNHLTGRPPGHGIRDVDLFYFDPDPSWEAEDRAIRRGAAVFAPSPPVEIRNQGRVHLWYPDRFGHTVPPFRHGADSLTHFAAETHAIGIRLLPDDRIDVAAPFGLDPVFALRSLPNTRGLNRETYETKAARAVGLWPEITVEPWPDITLVRAEPWHDWQAIHALVTRAFAVQGGRINPPSSLTRMGPDDFRAQAEAGHALLAHDGRAFVGCVFCHVQEGAFYLGKLAVDPDRQGQGLGRLLVEAAETEARTQGLTALELQTRIELRENCRTFMKLGFIKTGETSHPGFDRPTSITMRKPL